MAIKIALFATLLAVARAGIIGAPLAAPLTAPLAHNYIQHPISYATPAQLAYAAPITKVAAPLAFASPAPLTYAKIAAPLAYAAPIAKVAVAAPVAKAVVNDEFDPNPQYSFGYEVEDSLTGDSKSQRETRNGDIVQGSYSLTDPDGTRRTVDYTADPVNGFNAVVRREPLVAKALVAAAPITKVAAPLLHAGPAPLLHAAPSPLLHAAPAPLLHAAPAPLLHAAPAPLLHAAHAPLAYAAPVAKLAAPLAYAHPVAKLAAPVSYSTSLIH